MPNNNEDCLRVNQRSRGVIPYKVSDLENDVPYITDKDLEKIVWADKSGEYTGSSDSQVEVIVDNLYRTIKVKLLKTLEDDLKTLLPSKEGSYQNGTYLLKAVVSEGKPVFSFLDSGDIIKTRPYYYGNVSVDSSSITEEVVKSLSNGGDEKGNKEYTYYSYKQRQVFAYPVEYGKLTDITVVKAGIDVIDLFDLVTMEIDGVEYYVYISISSSTGEYTYRFIY